jgi:integrase
VLFIALTGARREEVCSLRLEDLDFDENGLMVTLLRKGGEKQTILASVELEKALAEYLQVVEHETQPMFWGTWAEITVIDNTVFNLYFDPNDGKYDHDRNENHVFKNLCNDNETYLCGLVLFSKEKITFSYKSSLCCS